jgi:hypothetical protein
MKSLKQYLSESEKTYEFKLRTIVEMSDEQLDKLERYLAKYNVESVSAPRKSIMQKNPAGFGDIGPAEVHSIEFNTKLPTTPAALQEELSNATGVPLSALRVHYKNESVLIDEEEKDSEGKPSKPKSVLADANYKDAEKVKHKDYYGNDFIEKFVKEQKPSKLYKEYKV